MFTKEELEHKIKGIEGCQICGKKLSWEFGKKAIRDDSPTLENMNCLKVLSLSDIQIVCHQCNTTKGRRTMGEFIEYCRMVIDKYGKCDGNIKDVEII